MNGRLHKEVGYCYDLGGAELRSILTQCLLTQLRTLHKHDDDDDEHELSALAKVIFQHIVIAILNS